MNKALDLEEKSYLEKRILNPLDRSLGRYNDILKYVKQNAQIEYWEQVGTKKRQAWIFLHLPEEISEKNYRYYSKYVEYKEGQEKETKIEKALSEIADKVFENY